MSLGEPAGIFTVVDVAFPKWTTKDRFSR